jgi:GT2 family glycosyltransferase
MRMSEEPQEQVPNRPVEFVAVINSFNRRALLEKALGSLTQALRNAPFGSAIVVFEAGSKDGSVEFLRSWNGMNPGDKLIVVESATADSSFSEGVNRGSAVAFERFQACRWLFLFETDNWLQTAEPLSQAIRLLEQEPQLGAVGFTVKRHSGEFCGYGMSFPTVLSLALGLNLSLRWNLDRPNDSPWSTANSFRWRMCDVVFTSPLLIRREAWLQTGGLDAERFPFSETDVDWAWRCAESGWKMAVIASDQVVHDNLQQASAWSANRVIEFHRSRLRLLKRHRGKWIGLIKPILFLRHCIETLLLIFRPGTDVAAAAKLEKRKQMLRTVWSDYFPMSSGSTSRVRPRR